MNFRYYKTEALVIFILVLYLIASVLIGRIKTLLVGHSLLASIFDFIDYFSAAGIVTLILVFVNYIGWKWPIFRWLINLPDLNGRYKGELVSSYINPETGQKMKNDCVVEIRQTSSSIHLHSYYSRKGENMQISSSHSILVDVEEGRDGLFQLMYFFINEPEVHQTDMYTHSGAGKFKYYPDKKVLEGTYYNQRKNDGTIWVQFEQKELLGRLVK